MGEGEGKKVLVVGELRAGPMKRAASSNHPTVFIC